MSETCGHLIWKKEDDLKKKDELKIKIGSKDKWT